MEATVSLTASEIFLLATQTAANPPDGTVTVGNADDGTMRAEWKYKRSRVRIGYPTG